MTYRFTKVFFLFPLFILSIQITAFADILHEVQLSKESSNVGIRTVLEQVAYFQQIREILSTNLLLDVTLDNTSPSAGEEWTYRIRYRCASVTTPCNQAYIDLTLPLGAKSTSLPQIGGNISKVSTSGDVSTGKYIKIDLQSQGVAYLEAGSSGRFNISATWTCTPDSVPQYPSAGSKVNLVQSVVFHEANGSITAPDPANMGVPVFDICLPPPSSSKDFTKKDSEGGSNIAQVNGAFQYEIIPKFPTSDQIEYIEHIPAGLQVYNFSLDRSKWDGWEVQCDCGNGFIPIYNSEGKNKYATHWTFGQKNKSHFPDLYGLDGTTDTGCDAVYDPDTENYFIQGLKSIKWITDTSGYDEDQKIYIFTKIEDGLPVGTLIQNCADAYNLTTSTEVGSSCKEITIVNEPIISNWVNIKSNFGTTDTKVSALSGYTKQPDDLLYEIGSTYYNMNGKNHTGFTITDTIEQGLSFITSGENPNWYALVFKDWSKTSNNLKMANQPGCQNPIFTQTPLPDGRTLLKWEFPACTFAGGLSHSSNPKIQLFFTVRYDRTVELPAPNYKNYLEIDYGKQVWDNRNGGSLKTVTARTRKTTLGSTNSFSAAGSVEAQKWGKGSLDSDFSRYPQFGSTNLAGEATYHLYVWNLTNEPLTKIDVADILPHLNDHSLLGSQQRESQWSVELDSAIKVEYLNVPSNTWEEVPASDLPLGILYGNSYNPCYLDGSNVVKSDPSEVNFPSNCSDMSTNNVAEGSKAFAFRWQNSTTPLQFGQGLRITVKTRQLTGELDPNSGEIAWNSFAYTATQESSGELFSSEPLKVGVQMINVNATASIGDKVWLDENGNGLQDPGESGIEGVNVSIYTADEDTVKIGGFPYRVATDSSGSFLFNGLSKNASYILKLDDPTDLSGNGPLVGLYLTTANAGAEELDSDAILDSDSNVPEVHVNTDSSSAPQKTFDFGFYRPVSIGDKVWVDIDENGQQDEGEPGQKGIKVRLRSENGSVLDSTTTDDAGQYSFSDLQPGSYSIEFSDLAADTTFTLQDITGDETNDSDVNSDGATNLFIVQENIVTIDAGIRPIPADPGSISGIVWDELNSSNGQIDDGEEIISGIQVQLLDDGKFVVATTTTDSAGQYSFTDLPANQDYYVLFHKSNSSSEFATEGVDMDADSTGLSGIIALTPNQAITDLDAGIMGTYSIGNLVWADANDNGLWEEEETGIAGVSIYLKDSTSNSILDSTVTDVHGRYAFSGLQSGNYQVQLSVPSGYRSSTDPNMVHVPNALDNDDNGYSTAFSGIIISRVITLESSAGNSTAANRTETDHGELINGDQDLTSNPKAYYTVDFGFAVLPSSESNCFDGIDEDGDGMTDCEDSDCPCTYVEITATVQYQDTIGPNSLVPIYLLLVNQSGEDLQDASLSDVLPNGFSLAGAEIITGGNSAYDFTSLPIQGAVDTLTWSGLTIPNGDTLLIAYTLLASSSLQDGAYANEYLSSGFSFENSTPLNQFVSQAEQTQTPIAFVCDVNFFQVYHRKNTIDAHVLGKLNSTSGQFETISIIDFQIKGLGYDPFSNLVYGASGNRFIRLDQTGQLTDLGLTLSGVPTKGAVDSLGNWYGSIGNDMFQVDIGGPAISATHVDQGLPGSAMTYHMDGNFYSIHDMELYRFDPTNNTSTNLGGISGTNIPTGDFSSMWTGSDQMLYAFNDTSGKIIMINPDSRSASVIMLSDIDLISKGGFSCPKAFPAVCVHDFGDNEELGPAISILPSQDADQDFAPDMDAIWLGETAFPDVHTSSNADGSGDSNDDGLVLPSGYLPGDSANFNIVLNTNMDNQEIHYGLWVDWDGDNGFDSFGEGSAVTSEETKVSETLFVPSDFDQGEISMRLRVANSEISEADSTGALGLGETEDYAFMASVAFDVEFSRATNSGLETEAENTWGAAWGDYDNDGDDDLLIPDYSHWRSSRLYVNNGNGTFTQTSAGAPTGDRGSNVGASWGDYDNDGDLDIYMANNVRISNKLYINNGSGSFSSSPDQVAGKYEGYSHSASWVDYNNDGYLDIFATDFMPTRFNELFQNNGNGTFSKAPGASLNMETLPTFNAVWGDYDNDGLMDVFVPNLRGDNNSLYHNDGNGKFTLINSGGVSSDGGNSHSASWADYDNDGDLDLFVANASNQYDFFYENNGDGTFTKITNIAITNEYGHSFGSVWGDFDMDGYQDLYIVRDNGNTNSLFFNRGDGTFSKDENSILSTDTENSISPTIADFDNDGDLDIFVANNRYKANTLYVSDAAERSHNWIKFDLTGTVSNADAVGATIQLKTSISGTSTWLTRHINALSGGVSGQSSHITHFGLGTASSVDSVIIYWPSGYVSYLGNQPINSLISLTEPQGGTITFKAFVDANSNCTFDTGETLLPNISGVISESGYRLVTNESGEAILNLEAGSYTYFPDSNDDYSHPCYTTISISAANGQASTVYLPQQAACSDYDIWVELSGTAQRRGLRNTYQLSYGNQGVASASNIDIAVSFVSDVIPISADVPWDEVIGGNTYVWKMSSLDAFESGIITITDSISALATMGGTAQVSANVLGASSDCDLSDNSHDTFEPIVGPIDPNDILVLPKDTLMRGDHLTYRIRFQNVGSFFAENVIITDTLPASLDPNSIQIVGTSHYHELIKKEDGIIEFRYEYIMLPDSGMNEEESHGFVEFVINPVEEIQVGQVIENRAAIVFDNEKPIITNTAQTLVWDKNIPFQNENQFSSNSTEEVEEDPSRTSMQVRGNILAFVFPNPAQYLANLNMKGEPNQVFKIRIVDSFGRMMFQREVKTANNQHSIYLPIEKWTAGYYYIHIVSGNEDQYVKFVKQ